MALEEIGNKLVLDGLNNFLTGMKKAGSSTSGFGKISQGIQSSVSGLSAKTIALRSGDGHGPV